MNITSSLVADKARPKFLPKHFGVVLMLKVERAVYNWMAALSKEYDGGYWHFYELNNNGVYMAPANEAGFSICVPGNGFWGWVSADAAGIIATLFSLNYLCNKFSNANLFDKYYLLLDFANEHREAGSIFAAID